MVNPGKRMNILKALLNLRHGPGAAILPPEITRIHMDFAVKWDGGHFGPRKFWRTCLPRLKYWNPAIPMLVNRNKNQEGPATMSIYFRQASADGTYPSIEEQVRTAKPLAQQHHSSIEDEYPAPPAEEGERVVTIDMKNIHSDAILADFLAKTGAELVHPSAEERSEMKQVEDRLERAAYDRAVVKKYVDDKRHQERQAQIALKEAEAIKAANR
ncbi:CI-B8 domain-containing protein [Xylariaceae sp. FL0255]|nr:CI-B8 domain-containing protein [Xylariaceae sp. FL0255]